MLQKLFKNYWKAQDNSDELKLDDFHYHEALDRTSMVCDILSTQVMTHPVFQQNNDLKNALDDAIDSLYSVYSKVGKKIIEIEDTK